MTALGELASIDALSGVASDTHEPFVQLRANGSVAGPTVLIGQLDPPTARELALNIFEAACAAEFDAALVTLMIRRLGDVPGADAQAASILADLRAHRGDA